MIDSIKITDVHYRIALDHPEWSISEEYVEENCFSELLTKGLMTSENMIRRIIRMEVKNGMALLPKFVRRICHDIVLDDCPAVNDKCDPCEEKVIMLKNNPIEYTRRGRSIYPKHYKCGTIWADVELYPMDCDGSLIVPIHYLPMLTAFIEYKYKLRMLNNPSQADMMEINIYKQAYEDGIANAKMMSFGQVSFDDIDRALRSHAFTFFNRASYL